MRAAVVVDGIVANIIEVASLEVLPGLVACPSNDIGDTWDGAQFAKPAQPAQPITVDARQIRQALSQTGFRVAVEAAAANGGQDFRDWWEYSTHIVSDHPQVDAMVAAIGATAGDKQAVFALAATL